MRISGAFIIVTFVLAAGCSRSASDEHAVQLIQNTHQIELQNGQVRLILVTDSSVITQTYFARTNGEEVEGNTSADA